MTSITLRTAPDPARLTAASAPMAGRPEAPPTETAGRPDPPDTDDIVDAAGFDDATAADAAQPRRSWLQRTISWMTGRYPAPVLPTATLPAGPTDAIAGPQTERREARRGGRDAVVGS